MVQYVVYFLQLRLYSPNLKICKKKKRKKEVWILCKTLELEESMHQHH